MGKTTKKAKATQPVPEHKPQEQYTIEPGTGTPAHRLEAEPKIIYDLATLVNVVYQIDIEPTKAGHTPKRQLKKIMPLLNVKQGERVDDDMIECYVDTLLGFLKNLKVIGFAHDELRADKIHVATGPFLATWSRMTLVQQIQTLLESWQSSDFEEKRFFYSDNITAGIFTSQFYGYSGSFLREEICTNLLDMLSQVCQPDIWYSLESLFKIIWKILAEANANPKTPHRYYPATRQSFSYENWLRNYGQAYLDVVMGFFKDLGLLEVGYDTTSNNAVELNSIQFRITEIGQQLLAKKTERERTESGTAESQQGNCIIQPNFDVMLLEPDLATVYQLLPFTQVKRINQVSTFQLTKNSIQRGLEAGYTIEQIIEILTQNSQKEVAQNVLYTLREWGEQYKIIRVSSTYVVETPDETAAALLLKNSVFTKMQPRQITACLFLVSNQVNIQSLKTALDKEGIRLKYHEASL